MGYYNLEDKGTPQQEQPPTTLEPKSGPEQAPAPESVSAPLYIKQLLELQSKDIETLQLKAQLKSLPQEFKWIRKKVREEQKTVHNSRKALEEKQQQLQEIEHKMHLSAQKITQYEEMRDQAKGQNEYTEWEEKLGCLKDEVRLLEEEGMALMEQIEDDSLRLQKEQGATEKRLRRLDKEIASLEKRKTELTKRDKVLAPLFAAAAKALDPQHLCAYLKVKTTVKHPPFIVPLKNHKCSGCHLRVSNEVQQAVEHSEASLCYCDQCGRILY